MKFKLKKQIWALAISSSLLIASGTAMAAGKIVISNDNNAMGVKGQTFEIFKKELMARLPGTSV